MKDNKRPLIIIGSAIILVVIGLAVTLVVINTRKNREPQTSESTPVIKLDIPGAGKGEVEATVTSEENVAPQNTTDKKDSTKDTKDTKTTAAKDDMTTANNQTKQQEEPVIIESKQEETPISNPQSGKGNNNNPTPGTPVNQNDDGIIELPFVPYEALKEN